MYYFASDLHLGLNVGEATSITRERLFVNWLDEVSSDAKAIFLVGDIFDFWYEYKYVVPRGYTRLLGKISELTDRGIEIHLFVGNHDIWAFDYLAKECGVILHHTPYEIMSLYGKQVFIGHGDVLGKQILIQNIINKIFRCRFAQSLFYFIHPDFSLHFGLRWSSSNRGSKPLKHLFRADDDSIVKFARNFLHSHNVDLFICGHIHCAEIYTLTEQCSIAFLGEWIESPTYGILSENGFELRNYPIR